MDEQSASPCEENVPVYVDGRDWYLVLCLGGLQSIVKREVVRHLAPSGGGEVYVFEEDCGERDDARHIATTREVIYLINDKPGAPDQVEGVHPGQAGCGKLLVSTDAPPDTLRSLHCVQGLFALVAHSTSVDIGRNRLPGVESSTASDSPQLPSRPALAEDRNPPEAALARLESLVTESPSWPAAVNVWKRFRTSQTQSAGASVADAGGASSMQLREHPALDHQPGQKETGGENAPWAVGDVDVTALKFRASVVRDGLHPFSSVEASPRLGGAVWSVNPGWTVDLKEYDVEVVVFILERGVVVGLALDSDRTKRCSNGRVPKEDKGFIETGQRVSSLRPSTAYLMLRLAEPVVGDVIVDCMCGVGTIPFMGAGWFPGVFFVGGEVDDSAIEHVRKNAQSLRRSPAGRRGSASAGSACAWDAQSLPLRDSSVDAMVVDMPFGQSCGTPRQNAKLYPLVMAEMARVLRPGSGRAVLLVTQPHLLGLPGLRRDNRKDRKKSRKKQRQGGAVEGMGHHYGGDTEAKTAHEAHEPRKMFGEATPLHAGISTDIAGQEQSRVGCGTNKAGVPQNVCGDRVSPNPEEVANVEPPHDEGSVAVERGALWRIRARHAVNVGGLVSYLLILDRTDEPSPSPRLDRRKRLVGLNAYCKRRKDGRVQGEVVPPS